MLSKSCREVILGSEVLFDAGFLGIAPFGSLDAEGLPAICEKMADENNEIATKKANAALLGLLNIMQIV